MVAALLQLDHSPTVVTPLPPSLLGSLKNSVGFFILRAILVAMPFSITNATHLRSTSATFTIFLSILTMYIPRLNPFTASSSRAVNSVLCGVFLEFLVPQFLEVVVK